MKDSKTAHINTKSVSSGELLDPPQINTCNMPNTFDKPKIFGGNRLSPTMDCTPIHQLKQLN